MLIGVQYAEAVSEEDFKEIILNGLALNSQTQEEPPSLRLSFLLANHNWRRRAQVLAKDHVPLAMLAGTPSPQEEHLTEILL